MSFFIPNSRKMKYSCTLTLHDLNNLPYTTGQYFAKWKVTNSSDKGCTSRATVKENKVVWNDAHFSFEVTLIIARDGSLQPSEMIISVKQETNGGQSSDKIGNVTISLSNLVGQGPSTQRYLLQNSKSNSLLKVSLEMKLLRGDPQLLKNPILPITNSNKKLHLNINSSHAVPNQNDKNVNYSNALEDPLTPSSVSVLGAY
ncbi:N-terminal C2 in EEIG1 and EHBP1 proteins-domain-containing protein [Globomyces pollinis-pini]|nr:N-terminal C2 in EEIG1 and EHBP1 proteins-domain-containing protein [Globomyces pollinis-pini]